jgi:small nuclear ribonucleoprotein (snRNP)-like protein
VLTLLSQLPLGLLNAAQGHPMLVELKNGETLNGHLVMCDTWMNLTLKEVVQTSPVYIRKHPGCEGGVADQAKRKEKSSCGYPRSM